MIRLVALLIIVLVGISSSQSQPVNTNINTNVNNNYNSNLVKIYLLHAIMRLSRIISSLQRSDLLKGQDIPPFPIPIEHIRSLVRDQMIELEKPDPVKEALESTDSLEGLGGDVAQTGPVDEDEVATFYRLVGDKFGGMSRDSDEFREMMERAIPAFRGRPAPPLEREDEW